MLVTAKILKALVLVFVVIDGTDQHKNFTQVKVGDPKKWSSKRPIPDALGPSKEVEAGLPQKRTGFHYAEGYNYGEGYNSPASNKYIAMGADGAAEVAFKIDMSLFMQRLNLIPQLAQVVANLAEKFEVLVYQLGQGGHGAQGGYGEGGFKALIISLEQSIKARLDQQDAKTNALYQLIQELQGQTGTIGQEIQQILAVLQRMASKNGFGGTGRSCSEQMAIIEGLIRQMMTTLAQMVEIIRTISQGSSRPGSSSGVIFKSIQQNFGLLQQITAMIERLGQQIGQGGSCSQIGQGGTATGVQILQAVSSVLTLIENLPQQILIVLKNSGIMGGSTGSLVTYIQKLSELCGSIITEVVTVRDTLIASRHELRNHFAESRRHLVAVKKVVTESTEMVSSAAAAISVSRKMMCSTGKRRIPDLED